MANRQSIIQAAIRLAGASTEGTTAPELEGETGCSARTAQRVLAELARGGALTVEVPERKGRQRGDWCTTYRVGGKRQTRYRVVLDVTGRTVTSVTKQMERLLPGWQFQVERPTGPRSRTKRLAAAEGLRDGAVLEVEELRDELQQWLDGMPENLQGGEKASQLEEAIGSLEEIVGQLGEVDFSSVEFPGMY